MTMAQIPTAPLAYDFDDEEYPTINEAAAINEASEISDDFKKCYSLSRTVKYLATIDLIFATIYSFFNYYFFIPMILIGFGFIGAKEYNKNYTLIYFTYTISVNIFRLVVFYEYYYKLDSDERSKEMFDFIIVILCCMVGLWIARIIYRFYRSIYKLTSNEITFLRQLANLHNYTVILW